jgi:hypothetical protein
VLELAGAARAAAQRDDTNGALQPLRRGAWLDAWETAVRSAAQRVTAWLDEEIEAQARSARMPARRWRRLLLTDGERRAAAARLASGGGPFVAALDELAHAAERVRVAGALDSTSREQWHDALRAAARRLEAAWLGLEAEVEEERARWAPEIAYVAHWRPPLWPVVVAWIPLAAALVLLGLMLGGYVPAPPWLAAPLGF